MFRQRESALTGVNDDTRPQENKLRLGGLYQKCREDMQALLPTCHNSRIQVVVGSPSVCGGAVGVVPLGVCVLALPQARHHHADVVDLGLGVRLHLLGLGQQLAVLGGPAAVHLQHVLRPLLHLGSNGSFVPQASGEN